MYKYMYIHCRRIYIVSSPTLSLCLSLSPPSLPPSLSPFLPPSLSPFLPPSLPPFLSPSLSPLPNSYLISQTKVIHIKLSAQLQQPLGHVHARIVQRTGGGRAKLVVNSNERGLRTEVGGDGVRGSISRRSGVLKQRISAGI